MRVLVCGGRNYSNAELLFRTLDGLHAERPIAVVIHGAAKGADTLGGLWAKQHEIPVEEYPADWTKHGVRAGPIRNRQMLEEGKPDLVVAFAGGYGTQNMMEQARKVGVSVREIA